MTSRLRSERGVTAIVVVVTLVGVAALMALAINVGHAYLMRGQLQNASDSGALAGTRDLDGTAAGLDAASASATTYTRLHTTDQSASISPTLIEFGHWTAPADSCSTYRYSTTVTATRPDGYKFCMIDVPSDAAGKALAALDVNAVRVRSDFDMFVAAQGILGPTTVPVTSNAVAVAGGPCHPDNNCVQVPLAIRAGCILGWDCGTTKRLGLTSATANNAGWANVQFPTVNPNHTQMCGLLQYLIANPTQCWDLTAYEDVLTNNGTFIDSMCASGTPNGTVCQLFGQFFNGKTVNISIVSYAGDTDVTCTGPYRGDANIKSFRTIKILHTYCNDPITCGAFGSSDCVDVQLTCDQPGPGPDYGCFVFDAPSPYPPRLVR